MKNLLLIQKKAILHFTYIGLIRLVDLSEAIVLKLNYIKLNYKTMLIQLFEEKDYSIQSKQTDYYQEHKYIKPIILWLSSLFGPLEEEVEHKIAISNSNINYFLSRNNSAINIPFEIRIIHIISILYILFMLYYFFT